MKKRTPVMGDECDGQFCPAFKSHVEPHVTVSCQIELLLLLCFCEP